VRKSANCLFTICWGSTRVIFDIETGCIRFEMRDELVGNSHFKILHGGMIATILDSEAAFILARDGAWRFETGTAEHPLIIKGGTVDLRIDYLRRGRAADLLRPAQFCGQERK